MSFFSKIRTAKKAANEHRKSVQARESLEVPKAAYRHVPTHAGSDAMALGSGSRQDDLRIRIKEQNKRRSELGISRTGSDMTMSSLPRPRSQQSISSATSSGTSTPIPVARHVYRHAASPSSPRARPSLPGSSSSLYKGKSPLSFSVSIDESPEEDELDDCPLQSSQVSTKSDSSSSSEGLEMSSGRTRPGPSRVKAVDGENAVVANGSHPVRFGFSGATPVSNQNLCVPGPSTRPNKKRSISPSASSDSRPASSTREPAASTTNDWFSGFDAQTSPEKSNASSKLTTAPESRDKPPRLSLHFGQTSESASLSPTDDADTSANARPSTSSSSSSGSSQKGPGRRRASSAKKPATYLPFPKSSKEETLQQPKNNASATQTFNPLSPQQQLLSKPDSGDINGMYRPRAAAPPVPSASKSTYEPSSSNLYTPPSSRPASRTPSVSYSHYTAAVDPMSDAQQLQRPASPASQASHRPSMSRQYFYHDRPVSSRHSHQSSMTDDFPLRTGTPVPSAVTIDALKKPIVVEQSALAPSSTAVHADTSKPLKAKRSRGGLRQLFSKKQAPTAIAC